MRPGTPHPWGKLGFENRREPPAARQPLFGLGGKLAFLQLAKGHRIFSPGRFYQGLNRRSRFTRVKKPAAVDRHQSAMSSARASASRSAASTRARWAAGALTLSRQSQPLSWLHAGARPFAAAADPLAKAARGVSLREEGSLPCA